jgi:hypothetical protein
MIFSSIIVILFKINCNQIAPGYTFQPLSTHASFIHEILSKPCITSTLKHPSGHATIVVRAQETITATSMPTHITENIRLTTRNTQQHARNAQHASTQHDHVAQYYMGIAVSISHHMNNATTTGEQTTQHASNNTLTQDPHLSSQMCR